MSNSYFVGDWLVEPTLLRVSRNGSVKKMEPQLMAVLEQLVSQSGQIVTKESLMNTVWAEVMVTENVLTRAISSLRKILEDDPFNPKYIETISKTGYRLIAPVQGEEASEKNETLIFELTRKRVFIGVCIIFLMAFSAFATKRFFTPNPSPKVYHPLALANFSNAEYWPAISPDGKFVAYGWKGEANDNWDIYTKLIGTETTLRITENPSTDLRAKWSPDGNYIYFLRYENGGSTIYKKSILGDKEIRILKTPEFSYGDFDISPDEKWISFNDRKDKSSSLGIKLISLETGTEKWLTNPDKGFNGDIHPTFSPDGSKLAFIREKNSVSMHLWLLDLNSKDIEQITTEHLSINGFDWSNDGNSLFYCSDKMGLYKLWEINLRTKKSTLTPVGDYQMVMPRVAESGRIIYAQMKDNVNIWSYNLENKTAKTWYATNNLNLNPSLSPDGSKACFTTIKDGKFQIWVSKPNGKEAVPITNFVGQYLTSPRWSPDNKFIVFQGFLNGQSDIYKVNALGGIPQNLTKSSGDDHTPIYSNKNEIYFSSNRSGEWGIWKMDSDGSNPTQLLKENAYSPQLNPDQTILFFCKKDSLGLYAYELEKGKERLITQAFHPMYWGAFLVDERGIYYLNVENKRFEYFDLESSESSFVYQPQGRIPRMGITLDLSPDSKQMLFSQIDIHDSDIMLLKEY